MNRRTLAAAGLIGLSLTALAAGPSLGQQAPAPASQAAPARDHHHDPAARQARIQARADQVRRALNLQPNQEVAFQAYQTALISGAMAPRTARAPEALALTTPERLDRQAARLAEHTAAFQRRADATRRFYAVLSPAQRTTFDALAVRADRGDGGHRHGGRGKGHGGRHRMG